MSVMPLDSTLNISLEMTSKFGLNVQATYNPIIRDTFYALVPADFKFYYMNAIRRSLHWYQGFVPEIHNPSVGMPATCIGNTIVKEITKLIIGGDVFFESKHRESKKDDKKQNIDGIKSSTDLTPVNETLKKFNVWSDKYSFQYILKQYVEYAAAGGTSALVTYINDKRDLFVMPYRIDQFFYRVGFSGEVIDYTGFIGFYTAKVDNGEGRKQTDVNYYLVERRYYKGDKSYRKYAIHRQVGNITTGQSFDLAEYNELKWEQLPKGIQKSLSKDFYGIKFGIEQEISWTDSLGVYVLAWTAENRVPEIKMGESVLLNIMSYMQAYEYAEAAMWTDMYLGRGKVLIPEEMRNPTEAPASYYGGYDAAMYEKLPMRSLEDQKPISIQFDLRAEEWSKVRNNIVEKMASTIGVSGSDLFSYLRDVSGGSKTATQIAAESQKTISYIYEKRSLILNALRGLVELWRDFYKQEDEIVMRFSSQNMVNKLVTLEESRVKKEIGYSKFDLFKEQNPDKDDDQINEMVNRSWAEERQRLEMQSEMNMKAFEKATTDKPNGVKGFQEKEETQEKQEDVEMSE